MKLLIAFGLLLFSLQTFAMEPGEYQCATRATEDMDSMAHGFRLKENSMVIYAFEGGNDLEEYELGLKTDDYRNQTVSGEDKELGMEFFKYKFYQESQNELVFVSEIKYSDSDISVETTTKIMQVSPQKISTVQTYTEDGYKEVVLSDCEKQ